MLCRGWLVLAAIPHLQRSGYYDTTSVSPYPDITGMSLYVDMPTETAYLLTRRLLRAGLIDACASLCSA